MHAFNQWYKDDVSQFPLNDSKLLMSISQMSGHR